MHPTAPRPGAPNSPNPSPERHISTQSNRRAVPSRTSSSLSWLVTSRLVVLFSTLASSRMYSVGVPSVSRSNSLASAAPDSGLSVSSAAAPICNAPGGGGGVSTGGLWVRGSGRSYAGLVRRRPAANKTAAAHKLLA